MALSSGWRCLCTPANTMRSPLLRVQVPVSSTPATASFSTSAANFEKSSKPAVKSLSRKGQAAQQSMGFGKRGGVPEKPKAAYKAGERKEIRNRIVLSNTNAKSLNLPELTLEISTHEPAVGTVFKFRDEDVDKLRALNAFRRTQDWKFFHRPSTVMRSDSLIMGDKLAEIEGEEVAERPLVHRGVIREGDQTQVAEEVKREKFHRAVICGPKGSGKSVLMLQAMTWALQRRWVVISIPNAHDLVIGHTEYGFDAPSGLWLQREYTASLLGCIASANKTVLGRLALSRDYKLGRHDIPSFTDLREFLEIGSKDPSVSHEVFMAFLSELQLEDSKLRRPPVLFTLDALNELMIPSEYRDTNYKIIHAHDLALPNTFLSFLSGKRRFPRGLILGATSASGAPRAQALEYALNGRDLPNYSKLDKRVAPSIGGAEIWKVVSMKKEEAKSLLEYCRESGLLREPEPLNDEQVAQRFALSSGLPKELVAGCVRIRA